MEHFGIRLIDKGKSFKLTRDEFAIANTSPSLPFYESLAERNAYADADGSAYSESWCHTYRELCLKNFDLNMMYFSKLDRHMFNEALSVFLAKNKRFVAVTNLNDYSNVEGFYIIVLGEYKQVYIGKTTDIKKRIMQHWSRNKPFDRTLFPMYAWDTSVFSIDSFRALDTTHIFAWKKKISAGTEAALIRQFPKEFCTNRIGGDITTALHALETMRNRPLLHND